MKLRDEFNWESYTEEYKQQLREIQANDKQEFFITELSYSDEGKLLFFNELHPNWKELYSTVWRLKPKTVYECGCGGGYNLKNIQEVMKQS